jgi:hypothetical protein
LLFFLAAFDLAFLTSTSIEQGPWKDIPKSQIWYTETCCLSSKQ